MSGPAKGQGGLDTVEQLGKKFFDVLRFLLCEKHNMTMREVTAC